MNHKLNRAFSRHRWLPPLITAAILLPLLAACVWLGMGAWVYILMAFTLLVSFFMGSGCTAALMNETLKAWQDRCDPYPMLEETTYQLGYVTSRSDRNILIINRCAGLIETGYLQQALEELEAINIDDPATVPANRYVYYHNLADAAIECGYREKAEIYYQKALQQRQSIKGAAAKQLRDSYTHLDAAMARARGDLMSAYALLAPMEPQSLKGQVSRSLDLARIAIGQGNPAAAKPHLEFVMRYGNRLYAVTQAQALWNEWNTQ